MEGYRHLVLLVFFISHLSNILNVAKDHLGRVVIQRSILCSKCHHFFLDNLEICLVDNHFFVTSQYWQWFVERLENLLIAFNIILVVRAIAILLKVEAECLRLHS